VLRTLNDQPSLWDAILPSELLVLPDELARVDRRLDDPAFFAPFVPFSTRESGVRRYRWRPNLRMMFLKFRYGLGYESLCREVGDSISWQRFCRIRFGTRVPHPTTMMKLTRRCGDAAVAGLNDALLASHRAQIAANRKVRADTTVVPAAVAYPTTSPSTACSSKDLTIQSLSHHLHHSSTQAGQVPTVAPRRSVHLTFSREGLERQFSRSKIITCHRDGLARSPGGSNARLSTS